MGNDTPTHPATDDQELANVLAGTDDKAAAPAADDTTASGSGLQFEETPLTSGAPAGSANVNAPAADPAPAVTIPEPPVTAEPELSLPTPPTGHGGAPTASGDLEGIKKDALEELRPLVDKLDLPSEEKFNIMLLIIRSTDDQSLVGPAHEAAKAIEDDQKRAQALLDIVKEIDYFSQQK